MMKGLCLHINIKHMKCDAIGNALEAILDSTPKQLGRIIASIQRIKTWRFVVCLTNSEMASFA